MKHGKVSVAPFDRVIDLARKLAVPLTSSGPKVGLDIVVVEKSNPPALVIGLHDLLYELADPLVAIF